MKLKVLSLLFSLLSLNSAYSQEYYWIGDTGNWSDVTQWSTTSGGANNVTVTPSSIDNVHFDANSFSLGGQTITVDANATCLDFDWTGVTNSPIFSSGGSTTRKIDVFGSLTMTAGLTYSYEGDFDFESSSTGKTITTAGHEMGDDINFNGAGGEWTLQDALSLNGKINLNRGTFITNNNNLSIEFLDANGSNTRTLALGTSVITINCTSGANEIDLSGSSLSYSGASATFTLSNPSFNEITTKFNGQIIPTLSYPVGTNAVNITGDVTITTLTFGAGNRVTLEASKTLTTNSLTAVGACSNYITIESDNVAANAIISSGVDQTISYCVMRDVSESGAGNLSCDNCVDVNTTNTNWDFSTGEVTVRTLYWRGGENNDENWSTVSNWTTDNTGGTSSGNSCVPTAVDIIKFNSFSFDAVQNSLIVDVPVVYCGDIDFTGIDETPTFSSSKVLNVNGSITLDAGLTFSQIGTTIFWGTGTEKITSVGKAFGGDLFVYGSGTYHLEDNLDLNGKLSIKGGVLDVQNVATTIDYNITIEEDWDNFIGTGGFEERAGLVTFDGSGYSWVSEPETFYDVTVNKSSSTPKVYFWFETYTVHDLLVSEGFLDCYGSGPDIITVQNLSQITGGKILFESTSLTVNLADNLNIDGGLVQIDGAIVNVTGVIDIDDGKLQVDAGTVSVNGASSDIAVATGEIELNGGILNIGDGTDEDLTISGGILDINTGTVNLKNQLSMTSGLFDQSGGTVNIGTATIADGVVRGLFSGGTYNLVGGTLDVKTVGAVGGIAFDIQTGTTVGTISTSNTIKVSESTQNSNLLIFNTKKIGSLEYDDGAGGHDLLLGDHLECDGDITISAGEIDPNGNNIEIGGDWLNNAASTAFKVTTESVTFDGTTTPQNIGGSASTTFHDLVISNSTVNGQVDIDAVTNVNGTLTMTLGDIEARDNNIVLLAGSDTPGISGGSADSHIDGSIVKTSYANDDAITFPVGDGGNYNPVYLDPDGATAETWTVAFNRSEPLNSGTLCETTFNHISSNYYWDINRAELGPTDAKVRLFYNSTNYVDETNVAAGELTIAHYDTGCSGWEFAPGNTSVTYVINTVNIGDTEGYVETSNFVTSFSPFTFATNLSFANQPLPVELVEFNAEVFEKYNYVVWSTSSEVNSRGFELQRSMDGETFETIMVIEGQGNSSVRTDYLYDDYQFNGKDYYRLKQVDLNGEVNYSNVIYLERNNKEETDQSFKDEEFVFYPNPSINKLNVNLFTEQEVSVEITITDALGKERYKAFEISNEGLNRFTIDLNDFGQGVYYINANTITNKYQGKFLKID